MTTELLVKYVIGSGKLEVTSAAREDEVQDIDSNLYQFVDGE